MNKMVQIEGYYPKSDNFRYDEKTPIFKIADIIKQSKTHSVLFKLAISYSFLKNVLYNVKSKLLVYKIETLSFLTAL